MSSIGPVQRLAHNIDIIIFSEKSIHSPYCFDNINTGWLQTCRKFIVNPAFAKRSVDGALSSPQFKKGTREKFKIDRKQMHASKNKRQFLKSERMEPRTVEFHRSSRGALYQKIEAALRGYVLGHTCFHEN